MGYSASVPEYVRAIRVAGAEPRLVFEYLADPRRLTEYCAAVAAAEPTESAEKWRVVVDAAGTFRARAVWLHRDAYACTIKWHSPGAHDYDGALAVTQDGTDTALTVTLRTGRRDGWGIRTELEATVDRLTHRLAAYATAPVARGRQSTDEEPAR